jgi:hypothetical protein
MSFRRLRLASDVVEVVADADEGIFSRNSPTRAVPKRNRPRDDVVLAGVRSGF